MKIKYIFRIWFFDYQRTIEFPSLKEANYYFENTRNIIWWEEIE